VCVEFDFVERLGRRRIRSKTLPRIRMSLKERFPGELPADTARVVEPLLAADSVYRLVGSVPPSF
jgi:hypothetical protein